MKAGDVVTVIQGCYPYFQKDDRATLLFQDSDGDWWADFNGHGNPSVYGDGTWCVTVDRNTEWIKLADH